MTLEAATCLETSPAVRKLIGRLRPWGSGVFNALTGPGGFLLRQHSIVKTIKHVASSIVTLEFWNAGHRKPHSEALPTLCHPASWVSMDNAHNPTSGHPLGNLGEDLTWEPEDDFFFNQVINFEDSAAYSGSQSDNVTSPIEQTFEASDRDCREEDDFCSRILLSGKCSCSACSKRSMDKELDELAGRSIPDVPHVFAFRMPEYRAPEQSNNHSFLHDVHAELESVNCEPPRNIRQKRRKMQESAPTATELMKRVLEAHGPISPELRAQLQLSVAEAESSGNYSQKLQPHDCDANDLRASTSRANALPTGMGSTRSNSRLRHYQSNTENCSSTAALATMPAIIRSVPNYMMQSEATAERSSEPVLVCGARPIQPLLLETHGARQGQLLGAVQYPCTFEMCDKSFHSKSDWKRHEKSVHKKQRYMCLECATGVDDPRGGYACGLCLSGPFRSADIVKRHTVNCEDAQRIGISFTRKDNLRTHLRERHHQHTFSTDAFDWVFEIDSDWAQECGFCGDPFTDWDLRADHIEVHFAEGKAISAWSIPFQKPSHGNRKCPEDEFSDHEDTDDENDDYENNEDYDNHNDYSNNSNYNSNSDDNNNDDNSRNRNHRNYRHKSYNDKTNNDTDNDSDDCSDDRFDDFKGGGAVKDLGQNGRAERPGTSSNNTLCSEASHAPVQIQKLPGLQENCLDSQFENNSTNSTALRRNLIAPEGILCNSKISTDLDSYYRYVPLRVYLLDMYQHELLALGIGRRPLNAIIGDGDSQSATITSLTKSEHHDNKSSQRLSTTLEKTRTRRSPEILRLDSSSLSLPNWVAAESRVERSSYMVEPCLDNLSHQMLVFLNQEDPVILPIKLIGKYSSALRTYSGHHQSLASGRLEVGALAGPRSTTTHSLETVTITSCSVDSELKSVALTNSLTSVASRPAPLTQWHTVDFDQMLTTTDYDYGFDLPCDYLGCKETFHAAELESWIEHSISHFGGKLPPKAVCPFCDNAVFNDRLDLESNWRRRMSHIFEHLQSFVAPENQRPDYFLLEHMWKKGFLNDETYGYLMRYTERPYCPNLVPFNYEPPAKILSRERDLMLSVDLAKQYRLKKKSKLDEEVKTHIVYGRAKRESTQKLLSLSGETRKAQTSPSGGRIRNISQDTKEQLNDIHPQSDRPGGVLALPKTTAVKINPVIALALPAASETAISPSLGHASSSFHNSDKFDGKAYDNKASISRYSGLFTSARSHNGSHMREERTYRSPDNDVKYISAILHGTSEIIQHNKPRYDTQEPRASDATPEDYKRIQYRSFKKDKISSSAILCRPKRSIHNKFASTG